MPRKNGIDTIRELTRDFPDSVCIAMSADGDSMRRNALEFAREAGARLTLRKPIEPWVLLRTLEGVVAGRRGVTRLMAGGLAAPGDQESLDLVRPLARRESPPLVLRPYGLRRTFHSGR